MKNLIFIGLILLLSCQGNQEVLEENIIEKELEETIVSNDEESDSSFIANLDPQSTNQRDGEGFKQGRWILYGKDMPEKGYPVQGKIEEGNYRDGQKIGQWLYYDTDGITVKQKSEYFDGALHGMTLNYDNENKTVTEIEYDMDKILSITSKPIEK